jgi:hypothetical protein
MLRIESEWPPSFRISSRSRVYWSIALIFSFLVVLTNLPDIIGCICGDNHRTILNIGSLKCFEGWFIEMGIIGIGRGNRAGKRETVPIGRTLSLFPLPFIAIIAGRSFFLA